MPRVVRKHVSPGLLQDSALTAASPALLLHSQSAASFAGLRMSSGEAGMPMARSRRESAAPGRVVCGGCGREALGGADGWT